MRWLTLLLLTGCAEVENPFIEPVGTGGGSAGGGMASAGGGMGGGAAGGTGGGTAACVEDWQCSSWKQASGGNATRTCLDVNQCGTVLQKPSEGPLPVPALDRNFYRCNVQVIFDKTCAMMGCHGTDTGRDFRVYSRGRFRNKEMVPAAPTCLDTGMRDLQLEGSGTVMCLGWSRLTPTEWQKNYDSARLFAVGLNDQAQSQLLTQPQKTSAFAHDGVKVYAPGEAPYETVKQWLQGATAPASCDGGFN